MRMKFVYGAFIAVMVVISGLFYNHLQIDEDMIVIDDKGISRAAESSPETMMVVYVTGSVKAPGVYEVAEGVRLHEVIDRAGGFSSDAAMASLNLARFVFDGEQIHVYSMDEAEATASGQMNEKKLISINSANAEELMTLTGIGEAKAEAIIAYREQNGPFRKTEDIMQVTGIKEAMYNKIKDDIGI